MQPAREVAGVGQQDGVVGELLGQRGDHGPHVEQAVGRRRPGYRLGHGVVELLDPLRPRSRRFAGQPRQRFEDGNGVGHQRLGGRVVASDLARVVVDMDQRLARHRRGRQRVALRACLTQPRADREHEIGLQIALHRRLGDLEAQVPRVVGMRVGEVVLPLEGERDRQRVRLRRRQQRPAPPRCPEPAAARNQQRPLRPGEQRRDLIDIRRRRRPRLRHPQRLDDGRVRPVLQHVLRQHDHHRPRRRRLRVHERARYDLGHACRVVDQVHGLGHVGEGLGVVHLLERAPPDLGARHLADEQNQRHRVLLGHVHGDRRVGRARPAAHERHARPPRELGVAHGHEPRAALVPAHDGLDGIAVMQGVEHGEIALARHAEHPVHAMRGKAIDKQIGGTARHAVILV